MRRNLSFQEREILKHWYSDNILDRAFLVSGSDTKILANLIHRFFGRPGAVTLGDAINIYDESIIEKFRASSLSTLAHEIMHVEQCVQAGGVAFYWGRYILAVLWGFLRHGGPRYFGPIQYRTHPFERPAFDRGLEVLEALGAVEEADWWRGWLGSQEEGLGKDGK